MKNSELQCLAGHLLKALINVGANKARISRWYDKKVKTKTFEQGELAWNCWKYALETIIFPCIYG